MEITWPCPAPERVAFAGDWHGNADAAWSALDRAQYAGAQVLIQLGDFGLWPGGGGEWFLKEVQKAARAAAVTFAWIDGNHEDFDQLLAIDVDATTGMREVREGVWHLPRGSRWQWGDARLCALGGATSLDKGMRREGKSWWAQEEVTDTDIAEAISGGPCDVLLTHDCPTGVSIPGIGHRQPSPHWPVNELERAWEHRDRLASALPSLRPGRIIHGHFHTRYREIVSLVPGVDTIVDGLADDSCGMRENMMVVDTSALAWHGIGQA